MRAFKAQFGSCEWFMNVECAFSTLQVDSSRKLENRNVNSLESWLQTQTPTKLSLFQRVQRFKAVKFQFTKCLLRSETFYIKASDNLCQHETIPFSSDHECQKGKLLSHGWIQCFRIDEQECSVSPFDILIPSRIMFQSRCFLTMWHVWHCCEYLNWNCRLKCICDHGMMFPCSQMGRKWSEDDDEITDFFGEKWAMKLRNYIITSLACFFFRTRWRNGKKLMNKHIERARRSAGKWTTRGVRANNDERYLEPGSSTQASGIIVGRSVNKTKCLRIMKARLQH